MRLVDLIRNAIRSVMHRLAGILNHLTGGKLDPDAVTIVGFVMHAPIALLIAAGGHNILAALLLFVFGLFDTLDGELARLQNRANPRGMLLDASTDRMKEVLLYAGAAYVLAAGQHPKLAVWAVAACGASLCVSYVKAKGEAAVGASTHIDHATLNKLFKDGLLTFELRMFVLIGGLLANRLAWALIGIAVLAAYTALWRLITISRGL